MIRGLTVTKWNLYESVNFQHVECL